MTCQFLEHGHSILERLDRGQGVRPELGGHVAPQEVVDDRDLVPRTRRKVHRGGPPQVAVASKYQYLHGGRIPAIEPPLPPNPGRTPARHDHHERMGT